VLAAIEFGTLWQVIWVSVVAGTLVTVFFSLVVLGSARSAEAQRNGRTGRASAFAGLAVLALAAFGAVVVIGVQIMLNKS
jgi:hypothetical protein